MARQTLKFYPGRKHLFLLLLAGAAVYVFLPQVGDFKSSWRLLDDALPAPVIGAVALTFGTFVAASGTYCILSFRRLFYGRTLLVQLAAMFVNRLLPAGLGALGANYLYLRHERHSSSQAGGVVAINNLLGFTGHLLLVIIALLIFSGQTLSAGGQHAHGLQLVLKAAGPVFLILVLFAILLRRRKMPKILLDVKKQLLSYRGRPRALLAAQATSFILTICNVTCLFLCLHALNLHLSFAAVVLVFTLGLSFGSAIPTPGGLGGFEAGLAAGFVAYGIGPAPALATALLYRLISYWLPLLPGFGAFVICQRRKLFNARS